MSASEMMMLEEELDELRSEVEKLRAERDHFREAWAAAQALVDCGVNAEKVVAERDELRDELNSLCEEIRILKEENDELKEVSGILNREILKENSELHRINSGLQEEVTRCGAALSSKKEHANIHLGGKGELHGIDGYGPFNLKQVDKDRWEIWMLHEKVTLYNKKGHRVRGDHNYEGDW